MRAAEHRTCCRHAHGLIRLMWRLGLHASQVTDLTSRKCRVRIRRPRSSNSRKLLQGSLLILLEWDFPALTSKEG
ncbi:hypothetical protein VULLAG_LOCUS19136 [Vulpes lagopus]